LEGAKEVEFKEYFEKISNVGLKEDVTTALTLEELETLSSDDFDIK